MGLRKFEQEILKELHETVGWLLVDLLVGLEGLSLADLIPEASVVAVKVVVDIEILKFPSCIRLLNFFVRLFHPCGACVFREVMTWFFPCLVFFVLFIVQI